MATPPPTPLNDGDLAATVRHLLQHIQTLEAQVDFERQKATKGLPMALESLLRRLRMNEVVLLNFGSSTSDELKQCFGHDPVAALAVEMTFPLAVTRLSNESVRELRSYLRNPGG